MTTLTVPLCSRCGIKPRAFDGKKRPKVRCAECHGLCLTCDQPAARMSSGYFRKYCNACRRIHEPVRETCSKCGKPRDGGHKSYCRRCDQDYENQRRRTHHESAALKDRRRTLWRDYGMTLDDYDALLAAQGGGCAGCGAMRSTIRVPKGQSDRGARGNLHIDHCHATGKIRGILCASCNAALGRVKDNPATLRRLADYLDAA